MEDRYPGHWEWRFLCFCLLGAYWIFSPCGGGQGGCDWYPSISVLIPGDGWMGAYGGRVEWKKICEWGWAVSRISWLMPACRNPLFSHILFMQNKTLLMPRERTVVGFVSCYMLFPLSELYIKHRSKSMTKKTLSDESQLMYRLSPLLVLNIIIHQVHRTPPVIGVYNLSIMLFFGDV